MKKDKPFNKGFKRFLTTNSKERPSLRSHETNGPSKSKDSIDGQASYIENPFITKRFWSFLLSEVFSGNENSISLQVGKKRNIKTPVSNIIQVLQHLEKSNENTFALDLSELKNPLLCLDIDDPLMGARIKKHIAGQLTSNVSFHDVFRHPLVIESATPDHLHLYYKVPYPELSFSKSAWCTRLGFLAEYVPNVITVGGQGRTVIYQSPDLNISQLPAELFPYNYPFKQRKKSLLHSQGADEVTCLIPSGERNTSLFAFCRVDNFDENHTLTINAFCCEEELPLSEIRQSLVEIKQRISGIAGKSNLFEQFCLGYANDLDSIRLRPEDSLPTIKYKSLVAASLLKKQFAEMLEREKFNPDRVLLALRELTPHLGISFVARKENEDNFFLDHNKWIGKSVCVIVMNYLAERQLIDIIYNNADYSWYFWDGKHWQSADFNTVFVKVYDVIANKISYGSLESKLAKKDVEPALKMAFGVRDWPKKKLGLNFQNGFFSINKEKNIVFEKHNKKFYATTISEFNYNPNEGLNLLSARIILDLTGGDVVSLNILRLLLYSLVCPGSGQFGFLINGEAGGTKSTMAKFIKFSKGNSVSSLDLRSVANSHFQLESLLRAKSVVIVQDADAAQIEKAGTAEIIKKATGGDEFVGEKKFGEVLNFTANVLFIIITNTSVDTLKVFDEPAIFQRLINWVLPSLRDAFRVTGLEETLFDCANNLVNWALHIQQDFVTDFQRVGHLNELLTPQKTVLDNELCSVFVFQKGNLLPTKDLLEAFKAATGRKDEKQFRRVAEFGKHIVQFASRLTDEQKVKQTREGNVRGFKNIAVKSNKGLLNGQEEFRYKQDARIKKMFYQDPFEYAGMTLTMPGHSPSTSKCPSGNLEQQSKLMVKHARKFALIHLIKEKSYEGFVPDSHLIWSGDRPGPKVEDFDYWNNLHLLPHNQKRLSLIERDELEVQIRQKVSQNRINQDNVRQLIQAPSTDQQLEEEPEISGVGDLSPNEVKSIDQEGKERLLTIDPERPKGVKLESKKRKKQPKKNSVKQSQRNKASLEAEGVKIDEFLLNKAKDPTISDANLYTICCNERFDLKNQTKEIKLKFMESKTKFANWSNKFKQTFNLEKLPPYKSFTAPYIRAETISSALAEFRFFPSGGLLPLIKTLNDSFQTVFDEAWETSKKVRQRNPHAYFGRNLPGTSESILVRQISDLNLVFEDRGKPEELQFWNGRSLFPLSYNSGSQSYRRLKGIPSATLSNVKQEIKSTALSFIKDKTALRFLELDLKSCHTIIFRSLSQMSPNEERMFPSISKHWSQTVHQFRKASLERQEARRDGLASDEKQAYDLINSWTDDQIKGLSKNQWYKALNGGSCFFAKDNLERSKSKLNISEALMPSMRRVVSSCLERMPIFLLLKKFQRLVNRNRDIFLATDPKPFKTATLSKAQKKSSSGLEVSRDNANEGVVLNATGGTTGMSRIFAACEIVLIMLLVSCLNKDTLSILPISYEADGLLLVGYFADEDLPRLLNEINQQFASLSKGFMSGEFLLEFKNVI